MSDFDFDSIDIDDPATWPTGDDLDGLPVLEQGWTDDLFYANDDRTLKVWQSRMTRADGAFFTHEITLETRNDDDGWRNERVYHPNDPSVCHENA